MNAQQRNKNRNTSEWLADQQRCPECGERGRHYVVAPLSMSALLGGAQHQGFWVCAKFYDEDGRRK